MYKEIWVKKIAIENLASLGWSSPFLNDILVPVSRQCNIRLNDALQKENINFVRHDTESTLFLGPKTWDLIFNDLKLSESLSVSKRKSLKQVHLKCPCVLCKINLQRVGFTERTPEIYQQGLKLFLWVFLYESVNKIVCICELFYIDYKNSLRKDPASSSRTELTSSSSMLLLSRVYDYSFVKQCILKSAVNRLNINR